MSSPQRENGYTAIAHELLEQIILAPLRGQQYKCLLFLARKTYGFNKKSDKLSLSQWAEGTGIERHNVWRELQGLIALNIIHVTDNGPKRPKTYAINKDYDTWNRQTVVDGDYKSVVADDYSSTPSVVEDDYKSVVTPHESTKERKESSTAAAAKRTISDFAKAYQDILGKMVESRTRSEEIEDWEKRVPYPAWEYALREALDKGHRNNWRYTTRILERLEREGYEPNVQKSQPATAATVNFALEELSL